MNLTNKFDIPVSLAVWLLQDEYNHNRFPGRKHLSATGFLKPIRQYILSQRITAEDKQNSEMDISKLLPSRRGTAIHAGVEQAWMTNHKSLLKLLAQMKGASASIADRILVNPTAEELQLTSNAIPVYIEQRSVKEINGWLVSGQIDFCAAGILEDFKTTKVYSYMHGSNDHDHMLQGSINRWLNPEMITEDYMHIRYIFSDWKKLDAMIQKEKGYPQFEIVSKTHKLLSLQETEEVIAAKLAEIDKYSSVPEDALPVCTPDELWQSDPVYKYFSNPNNKRATANCNSYAEAHQKMMANGGTGEIREIPGQIRRCGYCPGYELCTQKNEYLAKGVLVLP